MKKPLKEYIPAWLFWLLAILIGILIFLLLFAGWIGVHFHIAVFIGKTVCYVLSCAGVEESICMNIAAISGVLFFGMFASGYVYDSIDFSLQQRKKAKRKLEREQAKREQTNVEE